VQTTILRSTTALAATLAFAATAFFPGQASAATEADTLKATSSEYETIKHKFNYSENFVLETKDPYEHKFSASEDFVLETDDPYELADIQCGPGSASPFTPCDDVKAFCAAIGGSYEPGSCTLPDWPPPPSRD
jgi:hypothetical protein